MDSHTVRAALPWVGRDSIVEGGEGRGEPASAGGLGGASLPAGCPSQEEEGRAEPSSFPNCTEGPLPITPGRIEKRAQGEARKSVS